MGRNDARRVPSKKSQNETGLIVATCRHSVILGGVNMFCGELYAYSHFLHQLRFPNVQFLRYMKHSLGLTAYRRTQQPKISEKQRKKAQFCLKIKNWTAKDFSQVIWSDDSMFEHVKELMALLISAWAMIATLQNLAAGMPQRVAKCLAMKGGLIGR
ncbi:hypothetical protein FJT64_024706 [Amphibalanus amphitrite]|uniref:Uncharacterized protein n=1 Tax=Amphibalanus amphitrite TaxID=1232801 RepID=A0A6A4WHJ0_AMPAM|nr:hypothetical protein FJT64_024706 [Amphibalanus amphitrite]